MMMLKMLLLLMTMMMTGNGTTEMPFVELDKRQIYTDDEVTEEVKRRAKHDPSLLKAYEEASKKGKLWAENKAQEYLNDNIDREDMKLGNLYSLKDYFVKRTNESDLQVVGGKVDVTFMPIDNRERVRMCNKYRTVHLDGLQINCESLMPRGSEGFAIFTLYDERFVSQEKGFLGLVGFPLSKSVSKATLKINYSISTFDKLNWVAIITVYDHQLKDGMRPCNFHIKSFYKYTNNLSRFFGNDETEAGSFKIEIDSDNKGFAVESIRNSLDYSKSVLINKTFMRKLSARELRCLSRSDSSGENPSLRQIPMYGTSCVHKGIDMGRRSLSLNAGTSGTKNYEDEDSELKIDFENRSSEKLPAAIETSKTRSKITI